MKSELAIVIVTSRVRQIWLIRLQRLYFLTRNNLRAFRKISSSSWGLCYFQSHQPSTASSKSSTLLKIECKLKIPIKQNHRVLLLRQRIDHHFQTWIFASFLVLLHACASDSEIWKKNRILAEEYPYEVQILQKITRS